MAQQVQDRLTQKPCSQNITHFWHSKNSFEQKAALTFTVFLQTFVDWSWKHFIFVIWKSWRKLEENLEKIWGTYAEHFSFASLFFGGGQWFEII